MNTLQTCCPECQAQFPVSEEQLAAASGKVRCGSCLAIFDANAALIGHKENQAASITPLSAEEFAHLNSSNSAKSTYNTQAQSSVYDTPTQSSSAEDKWTQELLDDQQAYQRQADKPKTCDTEDQQESTTAGDSNVKTDDVLSALKDEAIELDVFEQLSSTEKQDFLSVINSQPIELTIDKQRFVRTKTAIACLLILTGLLALPLQYIIFNFDQLALHQNLRPSFKLICEHLQCQLPDLHDSRMIKTSNLIVRSHPDKKGALIVDALLLNRADFKQAYPDLELIFTNLQQHVVAARRFKPSEYLDGEQKNQSHMPIKQAVHISLQIRDPGAEAINYHLQLQAANL